MPQNRRPNFARLYIEQLEDRLAPADLLFRGVSSDVLDPFNWQDQQDSSIRAATATDNLIVANASSLANVNLTLGANAQFASLRLDEGFTLTVNSSLALGTLNLNGGTLTGSGPLSVSIFTFMNGTLSGSSQLTISSSFGWQGGTMAGSGTTTIASGASASISQGYGPSGPSLDGTRVFVNAGSTEWHAPSFASTASIVNNGSMTIRGGTFAYSSATLLQNSAGANLKFENCTVNITGPLSIGGSVLIGKMFERCTVTITGDISVTNLRVFADISGSGNVTVAGTFTWEDGTFTGPGSFVVAPTGTFSMGDYMSGGRILNGASLIVNGQRATAPTATSMYFGITAYTGATSNQANYDGWFTNQHVQPSAQSTPAAFDAYFVAGELHAAIFGGTFNGLNTDEDALFRILESYDSTQLWAVTNAYASRYRDAGLPRSLRTDLETQLAEVPDQKTRALALLDGNRTLADAAAIHYAIYPDVYQYWFTDYDTLFRVLSRYSTGTLSSANERLGDLNHVYNDRFGHYLSTEFDARLSGVEKRDALLLANLNRTQADIDVALASIEARALNGLLRHPDKVNQIIDLLNRNASRRDLLFEQFHYNYRTPLEPMWYNAPPRSFFFFRLSVSGWNTAQTAIITTLLDDGDRFKLLAARLFAAMDGAGTDEDLVWNTLKGLYADERARVAQVYRSEYSHSLLSAFNGDFEDSSITGNQLSKTLTYFNHGGLSLAQRLYYALHGWGTDSAEINAALAEMRNMTSAEIQALDQQYQSLAGESLETGLYWDLSGRDWQQAGQALRGRATTLRQEVDRLLESVDFDRWNGTGLTFGDISNILNGAMQSRLNNHGSNLDQSRARLAELISAYENGEATEAQVRQQMAIVQQDLGVYASARDQGAEVFANALTTAAAVGIGIFSGGTATLIALLVYTAIGAATNAVTRVVIQGQSYDLGDLPSDLLVGGISTGTAPFTFFRTATSPGFVSNVLLGALEGAANGGTIGLVQGAMDAAVRLQTWQDGYQLGLIRVGEAGVTSALVGIPTGAVIGGLTRALSNAPPMRRTNQQAGQMHTGTTEIPWQDPSPGVRRQAEQLRNDLLRSAGINEFPVGQPMRLQRPLTDSQLLALSELEKAEFGMTILTNGECYLVKGTAGQVRPVVIAGETLAVVHTHPGTRQIVPSFEDFQYLNDTGAEMRVVSRGDRANQALSARFTASEVTNYYQLLDPDSLEIVEHYRAYIQDMVERCRRRWNVYIPENLQIQADQLGVAWRW